MIRLISTLALITLVTGAQASRGGDDGLTLGNVGQATLAMLALSQPVNRDVSGDTKCNAPQPTLVACFTK